MRSVMDDLVSASLLLHLPGYCSRLSRLEFTNHFSNPTGTFGPNRRQQLDLYRRRGGIRVCTGVLPARADG